jgi:hypothetical protein
MREARSATQVSSGQPKNAVARHSRAWHMVQASKAEALLAADLYNSTGQRRSFEGFVVHLHLAWIDLLHGEFTRDSIDFRYWDRKGRRLIRADGEPRTWQLAKRRKPT